MKRRSCYLTLIMFFTLILGISMTSCSDHADLDGSAGNAADPGINGQTTAESRDGADGLFMQNGENAQKADASGLAGLSEDMAAGLRQYFGEEITWYLPNHGWGSAVEIYVYGELKDYAVLYTTFPNMGEYTEPEEEQIGQTVFSKEQNSAFSAFKDGELIPL